jgi:hypothetical protein
MARMLFNAAAYCGVRLTGGVYREQGKAGDTPKRRGYEKMTVVTFEIKTYEITIAREMNGSAEGKNLKFTAYINCTGDVYRATVYVLDDTSYVPANTFNTAIKWGNIFVPRWQFEWFCDLLRNEKPVYCYLNSDTPKWNSLSTGSEPVGEAEIS